MSENDVRDALDAQGVLGSTLPPNCPIQILGHAAGSYFFTDAARQFRQFSGRTLTLNGILDLFGGKVAWPSEFYPPASGGRNAPKTPFDLSALNAALIREAHHKGIFDADRSWRGAGVWDDGEGGLVVHGGAELRHYVFEGEALKEVRSIPAGTEIGGFLYAAQPPRDLPAGKPADDKAIAQIRQLLTSWAWSDPMLDPILAFGLIACQVLPQALPRRPPGSAVGPSGSGKSHYFDLIEAVTGDLALRYEKATYAGIRDELSDHRFALPVIVDEFEVRENNNNSTNILEMARAAFEPNRGNFALGGAEGRTGKIEASFLFGSVEPPPMKDADENRHIMLEFRRMSPTAEAIEYLETSLEEIRAVGPALRHRLYSAYPIVRQGFKLIRRQLVEGGLDGRRSDALAIILAAASALAHSGAAAASPQLKEWIETVLISEAREGDGGQSASARCWAALVGRRVRIGQSEMVLGSILKTIADGGRGADWIATALKDEYGILIRPVAEDPYRREIVIADNHPGLEEIFKGTDWAKSGWRKVLPQMETPKGSPERLPNAIFFGQVRSRGVRIPLEVLADARPVVVPDEPPQAQGEVEA